MSLQLEIGNRTSNMDSAGNMESTTEDHSSHMSLALLVDVCEGRADITELPRNVCRSCERINTSGDSPVLLAVSKGNRALTHALLNAGYSAVMQSYDGDFPLWSACFHGHVELVELLLQYGADINMLMSRNTRHGATYHARGGSVLEVAISNNRLDLAHLLIQSGIDVNLPDATYRCPLFNAITRGHAAITSLILEHPRLTVNISGPHIPSPLVAVVATGMQELIKRVVKVGAELNCFGDDVRGEPHTPLTKACQMGHVEVTKFLLESGAQPNYHYTRASHMFPLHYAVKYPYQRSTGLELVKLLVQHGANVNLCNQYGESPVFMAVYLSSTYVLVHLVQNGANVANGRSVMMDSCDQRSPLELAIDFGYAKIALMLAECMTYFAGNTEQRLKKNIARLGADASQQLQQKFRNPQSLQSLCRGVVREVLGGLRIKDKVNALVIPVHLKGYLCFDMLCPYFR